jgi:LPS-assembly protein
MTRRTRKSKDQFSARGGKAALRLLALAAAVGACCAGAAEYTVTTSRVKSTTPGRMASVTSFTNAALASMSTPGAARYLQNQRLADSSTFAARVTKTMNDRRIRMSPFRPIPQRDLSYYAGVPSYTPPRQFDVNTEPVHVEADQVSGNLKDKDDDLVYTGRVVITQGDRVINTDRAHYSAKNHTFTVSGKSLLHDGEYTVNTDEEGEYGLDTKVTKLKNTRFLLNGSVIRGTAEKHTVDAPKRTQIYKKATLTSCPIGNNDWALHATTVNIDKNEAFGEAWNVSLYTNDFPVFYFPYVNFPITNDRKTGLLYPLISTGSSSFKYVQPIYFNLAPNYDLTFTPAWYGEHHAQYNTEFRYMPFSNLYGTVTFNYLPDDASWTPYDGSSSKKRWYLRLTDRATFLNGALGVGLDYQRVRPNDYSYLSDLATPNAAITDDHLMQRLWSSYGQPTYTLNAELRRYQVLLPEYRGVFRRRPFAMLPKLSGSWYGTDGIAAFDFYGEATRFELESFDDYSSEDTIRLHAEPSVMLHLFDRRGTTLEAGGRLFLTHYSQGDLNKLPSSYRNYFGFDSADSSKNRFLYELEVHGKTTFERKAFDMRHTQTIEPEFKYTYVPYRNQNSIALYDTTDRIDDYYTLFSYRRYSGLDRIADTNTITMGLTSRVLDAHDREVLKLMAAQSYSFVPTRVTLNSADSRDTYPRSLLTGSIDANPVEGLNLRVAGAYSTQDSQFQSYSASATYQKAGARVTANYRYLRDGNYDYRTGDVTDIRQVGVGGTIPLGRDWRATAAIYRDIDQSYNIDRKVALKYEESCWSIALVYEDYAKMDWSTRDHKDDNVLGVQFEFKGFYTVQVEGIDNPMSPDTHYMPFADPTSLNR